MADFNKLLPDGDKAAPLMDDDCQENFQAIEENGLDPEHDFSTGGTQTGRHKFAIGDTTTLEGNAEYVAGSMALCDDVCSTGIVPIFKDDADPAYWWHVLEPYLAHYNDWSGGQFVTPSTLASSSSIASGWRDSNIFYLDLGHNGLLANPTDMPAEGKVGVWFYLVQQDSGGPWQTTYGSKFVYKNGASGTGPPLSDTENDIDVLMCTLRPSGAIDILNLTRPYETATTAAEGAIELATDAEMAAMDSDSVVPTPSNFGSADMGTTTSSVSWNLLGGKHATYGNYIIQAETITLNVFGQGTFTFATPFASSSYEVLLGSGTVDQAPSFSGRDTTHVDLHGDPNGVVCVMCYGPLPA